MESYKKRLGSFENWPATAAVKPADLAAAGLYYGGEGDKTICYMCRRVLYDWSPGDDPYIEHSKAYPDCRLSHNTKTIQSLSRGKTVVETEGSIGGESTADTDQEQYVLCEESDKEMQFYEKRLETFKNWPACHPVTPELLARCGQFYTGEVDETQCFACHRRLQNWNDIDDPYDEHKKNFPECQLSKLPKEAVLVPIKVPGNQSDGKVLKGPVKSKPELCTKCKLEKRSIVFACAHVLFCKECAKQEKMLCSKCKPKSNTKAPDDNS